MAEGDRNEEFALVAAPAPAAGGIYLPLTTVQAHEQAVHDAVTLAIAEIVAVYEAIQNEEPDVVRDTLLSVVGPTARTYGETILDISTAYYDDLRELSRVDEDFLATPIDLPVETEFESLIRWAVDPLYGKQTEQTEQTALERIADGMESRLRNLDHDNLITNASEDPVDVRWARVPQPGACTFCGLMAANGAVYRSKESALIVGGRGMPVEKTHGKRGGQAKGIRARGNQKIGERFHDNCRCGAVVLHGENAVEMPAMVQKYKDAYDEITPGTDLTKVLKEMRELLGTA